MPLTTISPSLYAPNTSSLRNTRFVSQAISELLKNTCIEESGLNGLIKPMQHFIQRVR